MRSRDSRAVAEHALRGLAVAAMIALVVRLWLGTVPSQATATIASPSLDSALATWITAAPDRATLHLVTLPGPVQRDWLRALRRTGFSIGWRTEESSSVAVVAEAGVLPEQPMRITALGSVASSLTLADELGAIDSANTGDDGVVTWNASPAGTLRATTGSATATTSPRYALNAKPVLVIGQAGWETKFVTAALEESGWSVSTRMTIAPGAIVRQGSAAVIDTSSFSAVVVLDSTSELQSSTLARFVSEGGGVLAAGAGINHPSLRSILPRATSAIRGELGAIMGPTPRVGLHARRIRLDRNAVTLEQRGTAPVVVARRIGAGRVAAVGYDDTWRARLSPPNESAPEAHRVWWSSLVAGVAHTTLVHRETGLIDEAPFVTMISALGPPLSTEVEAPGRRIPWNALLAALAALALLGEWLSRRLRGVA